MTQHPEFAVEGTETGSTRPVAAVVDGQVFYDEVMVEHGLATVNAFDALFLLGEVKTYTPQGEKLMRAVCDLRHELIRRGRTPDHPSLPDPNSDPYGVD
jgi:hypothetical protein